MGKWIKLPLLIYSNNKKLAVNTAKGWLTRIPTLTRQMLFFLVFPCMNSFIHFRSD